MFKDNFWLIYFIFYVLIKILTCILWSFTTLICQPKPNHQELQYEELSGIWNTENTCLSKAVIKVSAECVFPGGCVQILNSLLEDSCIQTRCFMEKNFKISVWGIQCDQWSVALNQLQGMWGERIRLPLTSYSLNCRAN